MPIRFDDSFWATRWASRDRSEAQVGAAILAAGLGRRLEPLTAHLLPKPQFPLGGRTPISELWVRRLLDAGIADVRMNVCVLPDAIRRHYAGGRFGIDLHFVEEEVPTGTLGGACKQALGSDAKRLWPEEPTAAFPAFGGSTIVVPSGDIVTNFGADLLEEMYAIHRKVGAAFTMVVNPIPENRKKDFGTVVLEAGEPTDGPITGSGRVLQFVEKDPRSPSNLNNASIYMIEMDLLRRIDPARTEAKLGLDEPFYDFGKHVFPALLGELAYVQLPKDCVTWAIQYEGEWFDVGSKRDYLKVNEYALDGRLDVPIPYERLPWGWLGSGALVDFARVEIVPPVVIGEGCVIEPGAVLGPYAVIGDGWVVEKGARIERSVLWARGPYHTADGREIPAADRQLADRHTVRRGVRVSGSIVAGGTLDEDVTDATVHAGEDGALDTRPIDWVPQGPRA